MYPFYQIAFGSVIYMIARYSWKNEESDKLNFLKENSENFLKSIIKEYDFIIVGGGSAGCVVANKLSEQFSVLLLEQGGDQNPFSKIPANFFALREPPTSFEWTCVKQKFASFGNNNGQPIIHQGKSLGGSSTINGMVYNRGNPYDYDNWAEKIGDNSWAYTNLVKYFKMSENFYNENNFEDHLGKMGPMLISPVQDNFDPVGHSWLQAWKRAGEELGYKSFENPNVPQIEGFGGSSENKYRGQRFSTYDGFLKPILDRKNLEISIYSEAKEIIFDNDNRAIGVKYLKHGVWQYAKCKKEIILSAGTLNSPLILMRSGIGPADQLKAAGIPIRVNLPSVGQFFQDHPSVYFEGVFPQISPFSNLSHFDIENYIENGKGPLSTLGIYGQAFFQTKTAKINSKFPDKIWPHSKN